MTAAVQARRIVAHATMPERATPAERLATLDKDIREAAAKARKSATDHFLSKFSVTGWEIDEEDWGMGVGGQNNRTVTVVMRITRAA